MRISEAIDLLRGSTQSGPWEQQNLLIEPVEFPADKRLRFYSPESERHFFNVIFEGSYKSALAAISHEDDLLAICRDEIEKFHNLYVYIPRVQLLEDQRKARIPLVNIFRYYGLWLCIAENQKPSIVSRDRVLRDFQARVDVAFKCYVNLLEWMCKRLNDLAKSDDSGLYAASLVLLQRVLDIPLTTLKEDQARIVLKILDVARLAEEGMTNRMIRAKREAVDRFHQCLTSCSGTSEFVSDDLPIHWSVGENFQTSDRSLDHEFSLLSRRTMTLSKVRTNMVEPAWHFPELPRMESALNSCEINQFIFGLQSVQDTDFIGLYEYLCKSILFSGDARDTLVSIITESRRCLSVPPYVGNSVHCVTLTHTLLAHFYAFLSTDDSSKVVKCFQVTMNQLDRALREQPRFDLESAKLVGLRTKHTWRNWRCPWGLAYHFWRLTNGEVGRGGVTDGSTVLQTSFGGHGEQLVELLSSAELVRLFSTLAKELGSLAGSDWTWREFKRLGFVVTADNCYQDVIGRVSSDETWHEPARLESGTDNPIIGLNLSKKWEGFQSKYEVLHLDPKIWKATLAKIIREAESYCNDMLGTNSIPVQLADELKRMWRGKIERVLIGRLVTIALERHEPVLYLRLYLVGRIEQPGERFMTDKAKRSYHHYISELGFMADTENILVFPKSYLWPHESTWLSKYRPPKS